MTSTDTTFDSIKAGSISTTQIVESTGLSASTVRRSLKALVEAKRVRRVETKTGRVIYAVAVISVDAVQPADPKEQMAVTEAILEAVTERTETEVLLDLPAKNKRGNYPLTAFAGGMRTSPGIVKFWREHATGTRVVAHLSIYSNFIVGRTTGDLQLLARNARELFESRDIEGNNWTRGEKRTLTALGKLACKLDEAAG